MGSSVSGFSFREFALTEIFVIMLRIFFSFSYLKISSFLIFSARNYNISDEISQSVAVLNEESNH